MPEQFDPSAYINSILAGSSQDSVTDDFDADSYINSLLGSNYVDQAQEDSFDADSYISSILGSDYQQPQPSRLLQSLQQPEGFDQTDPTKMSFLYPHFPQKEQPSYEPQAIGSALPDQTMPDFTAGMGSVDFRENKPEPQNMDEEIDMAKQEALYARDTYGADSAQFEQAMQYFEMLLSFQAEQLGLQSEKVLQRERENLLSLPILAGKGFVGGATFGLSDAAFKMLETELGGEITADSTTGQVMSGVSRLIGAVTMGKQVATGMKNLMGKYGVEGVKAFLGVRLGTSAVMSGVNNVVQLAMGEKDVSTAARDIGIALGGSLIGIVPEKFIKAGPMAWKVTNALGQVATDFLYDAGVDGFITKNLNKSNYKEWLINEMPNLAQSMAMAGRDLFDPNFEMDRQSMFKLKNQMKMELKMDVADKFGDKAANEIKIYEEDGTEIKMPQDVMKSALESQDAKNAREAGDAEFAQKSRTEGTHESQLVTRLQEDAIYKSVAEGVDPMRDSISLKVIDEYAELARTDPLATRNDIDNETNPVQRAMKIVGALQSRSLSKNDSQALLDIVAEDESSAGQFLRIARELKTVTPEGRASVHQKVIERWLKKQDVNMSKIPENLKGSKLAALLAKAEDEVDDDVRNEMVIDVYSQVIKNLPFRNRASFKLLLFRYSNALSSPRTHLKNVVGNTMSGVIRPASIAMQELTGFAPRGATKEYVKSAFESIPKAVDEAREAFKGGDLGKMLETVGTSTMDQIRVKNAPAYLTLIPRMLSAADKLSGTIIEEGERLRLIAGGTSPEVAAEKAKDTRGRFVYTKTLGDPKDTDNVISKALDLTGSLLEKGTKTGVGKVMLQPFMMFLRTPTNVAKQQADVSPLAFAGGKMTKNSIAKARYGTEFSKLKKDQQDDINIDLGNKVGEGLIGTAVSAIGALLALNGKITLSAPKDPKEREAFYAAGRKPNSVEINGHDVPLIMFGPLALALAIPAAVNNAIEDNPELAKDAGLAERFGNAMAEIGQFWLRELPVSNLNGFMRILSGDEKAGTQIGFTAEQMIPASSLLRFTEQIRDRVIKKPKTAGERIIADLPFAEELFGEVGSYDTPTGEPAERTLLDIVPPWPVGTRTGGEEEELYQKKRSIRQIKTDNNSELSSYISQIRKGKEEMSTIVDWLMGMEDKDERSRLIQRINADSKMKKLFVPYKSAFRGLGGISNKSQLPKNPYL